MKRLITLGTLMCMLFVISSCCPLTSLNPLSDPKNVSFDNRLEGLWQHKEEKGVAYLHIGKGDKNMTHMIFVEHEIGKQIEFASFILFPTKINNENYLNLNIKDSYTEIPGDRIGFIFLKYELLTNSKLSLSPIDSDEVIAAIETGKVEGSITYNELIQIYSDEVIAAMREKVEEMVGQVIAEIETEKAEEAIGQVIAEIETEKAEGSIKETIIKPKDDKEKLRKWNNIQCVTITDTSESIVKFIQSVNSKNLFPDKEIFIRVQ